MAIQQGVIAVDEAPPAVGPLEAIVVAPDGDVPWAPPRPRVDNAMVKALARAFRWRKLLETGVYATIDEIAAAENINDSYVSRLLRLTLLAPRIVELILDGRQPATLQLMRLMKPIPVDWRRQSDFVASLAIKQRCTDGLSGTELRGPN